MTGIFGAVSLAQGFVQGSASDGRCDVTVPAFDAGQQFNDCVYMPRGDSDPSHGDRCLVAFDDQGAAWVVAWE